MCLSRFSKLQVPGSSPSRMLYGAGGCLSVFSTSALSHAAGAPDNQERITDNEGKADGFTLVELMVVIAVIVILAAVVAPAFTNLKSAGDVTGAADTIKGVLEQARNHAMANNAYTWVGFFEEDGSKLSTNPATAGNGRLVLSAVASIDGTNIYGSGTGTIDPTKLKQILKLVKIENVHLPLFAVGSGAGDTFDTRPALQFDPTAGYNYSRFGELNAATPNTAPYTTPYNFQYPVGNPASTAQYTFSKLLQCNPRGEFRVNGVSFDVRRVVEIGLVQTHANTVPAPTSGAGTSTATYSGNVAALQISGFGGNAKIYRR
jgi:prepilin-type N-terminal cleavage/methylation domain-containing protein